MENCLVTIYDAAINDASVPKYGEIILKQLNFSDSSKKVIIRSQNTNDVNAVFRVEVLKGSVVQSGTSYGVGSIIVPIYNSTAGAYYSELTGTSGVETELRIIDKFNLVQITCGCNKIPDTTLNNYTNVFLPCVKLNKIDTGYGKAMIVKLETIVAGMISFGRVSGELSVIGTYTNFHGTAQSSNKTYYVSFSDTGATVKENNASGTLLATYTKSNDTWTYA